MTPESAVAQALADVVEGAAPLAVVYPWRVIGQRVQDWAAVLRSPGDSDRVHGWTISRTSVSTEAGMSDHPTSTEIYSFLGLHYHEAGNEDANTDYVFQAELDAIRMAFSSHASLPGIIADHDEFQVLIIDHVNNGAQMLHFAQAILALHVC